MESGKTYYYNDKELYDGLLSSQRRMNTNALRQLALSRGILFSGTLSREDMCDSLATICHDYYSLEEISQRLAVTQRRTRCSRAALPVESTLTVDQVGDVLRQIKDEYSDDEGSVVTIQKVGDASYSVNLKYMDVDLSRTSLRQKVPRDAEFVVDVDAAGLLVRAPSTDKGAELVGKLQEQVSVKTGEDVEQDVIELVGVSDPAERTQFFIDLLDSIPSMPKETVIQVKVASEALDGNANPIDVEDIADGYAGILRAQLDGGNILMTDEYRRLKDSGFFIAVVRWYAKDSVTDHIVEFVAGFKDQENSQGFYYDAASIKLKRDGGHSQARSLRDADRTYYLKRIEEGASESFNSLKERIRQVNADPSTC